MRTLLQDSWGELTHEDTYSKASESPPLVVVLSTRMADLLSTLDDIAEDLRNELDRIDEAIVDETAGQVDEPSDVVLDVGPSADAADLLLERWNSLDRPLELSSLAWALQHEFGAEVSDDWFGFRTFKRFLRAAIPDGEISSGRRAYLLPPGSAPSDADDTAGITIDIADIVEATETAESDQVETGPGDSDARSAVAVDTGDSAELAELPSELRELRRVERGFPLVSTADWQRMYELLAELGTATEPKPLEPDVNQLTRSARDRARSNVTSLDYPRRCSLRPSRPTRTGWHVFAAPCSNASPNFASCRRGTPRSARESVAGSSADGHGCADRPRDGPSRYPLPSSRRPCLDRRLIDPP